MRFQVSVTATRFGRSGRSAREERQTKTLSDCIYASKREITLFGVRRRTKKHSGFKQGKEDGGGGSALLSWSHALRAIDLELGSDLPGLRIESEPHSHSRGLIWWVGDAWRLRHPF